MLPAIPIIKPIFVRLGKMVWFCAKKARTRITEQNVAGALLPFPETFNK